MSCVRHIVAWNYGDGLSEAENAANAARVKTELEHLGQVVDGAIAIDVHLGALPSGERRVILNSVFTDGEALAVYQVHPEHQRVSAFISTVFQDRVCLDYYEQ